MQTPDALRTALMAISGRDYPAYRSLLGTYDFGHFIFDLDHIQKDPFAAPTRARLRVPQRVAKFPARFLASEAARRATADWIVRRAAQVIGETLETTGRSAALSVDAGGQHVLRRTAAVVDDENIELRLNISLPGEGRTVLTEEAERLLFHAVPTLCREALLFDGKTSDQFRRHVEVVEDQVHLRAALAELGLVAFIGNGAILPRQSGESCLPMDPDRAVAVTVPRELRVTVELPHAGKVTGVGIPAGVTVIVGGAFHGKSTLMNAIQQGVYDHIPGDGRELVVTDSSAMRIAAEEGRYAAGLDLRAFVRSLPDGTDVADYSSESAPASLSQAANLLEALEMGCKVVLLDEDDCAVDFMSRDARMQALVGSRRDPLIPYIDRVRVLKDQLDVSTVVAVSGSGDYLEVADTVLMMDRYAIRAVTKQAADVVAAHPSARQEEKPLKRLPIRSHAPQPSTISARRGRKPSKVNTRGTSTIQFGRYEVDVSRVSGIVDPSQLRAIADAIEFAARRGIIDGSRTLREVAEAVAKVIAEEGLDRISPHFGRHPGDYAEFRPLEFAAALCRLRAAVAGEAQAAGEADEEEEIEAAPETPEAAEQPSPAAQSEAPKETGETRSSRRRRRGRRSRRSARPEAEASPAAAEPEPEPEPEPSIEEPEEAPDEGPQALAEPERPQPRRRRGRRSRRSKRTEAAESQATGDTVEVERTRPSEPEVGHAAEPIVEEGPEPAPEPDAREEDPRALAEADQEPARERRGQRRPPATAEESSKGAKARRIPRRKPDLAPEPPPAEPEPEPEPEPQPEPMAAPEPEKPTARRVPRRPVSLTPPPADPPKPAASKKRTRKPATKSAEGATPKKTGATTPKTTAKKSTAKATAKRRAAPKKAE